MYRIRGISLKPDISSPYPVDIMYIKVGEFININETCESSKYHIPLNFDIMGWDLEHENRMITVIKEMALKRLTIRKVIWYYNNSFIKR